jgi:RNA polymerase sigma-70 factor (ECF subfamily)
VSEADLIRQAQQGDPDAWEPLMRTHQAAVFRLAYLLLGDPDEAEDAAQETFLRAYHALRRFDPSRPLRPWLMQIASNLVRNQRRSLGRQFKALMRLAAEPAASEPSLATDDTHTLWNAIRKMSFEHQQVIYLRFFLDMSEQEISAAVGIAPGTVKSRLHRALAALRQVISRNYPQLEGSLNL